MALTVVFMGTPEFAVPTLSAILTEGHRVAAVYTQPPRAAGRGLSARKSPVHMLAETNAIPVCTPTSLRNAAAQDEFRAWRPDVAVVVAYGLILPGPVLAAPRSACLNLHASRLPRWRGAAPIQRSIMAGDTETAATIMLMEEGLDTGPVCLSETVTVADAMTAGELHDVLMRRGAGLMVRALGALERGELAAVPQPAEGVTYAAKIDKGEARIDFARPAREVHNHIRGLSPFPGAWLEAETATGAPERIKVLRSAVAEGRGQPGEVLDDSLAIACAEGAIRLIEVQRAGKKAMTGAEFLRGFTLSRGMRLAQA